MNNIVNSYTSWQPLEEVIVGRAYTPDYFDFIDNPQVRNQLQQIYTRPRKILTTYNALSKPTVLECADLTCLTRINLFGSKPKGEVPRCRR